MEKIVFSRFRLENNKLQSLIQYGELLNNRFSLHHSIIFFLNGWENLYYELGSERVKGEFD